MKNFALTACASRTDRAGASTQRAGTISSAERRMFSRPAFYERPRGVALVLTTTITARLSETSKAFGNEAVGEELNPAVPGVHIQ